MDKIETIKTGAIGAVIGATLLSGGMYLVPNSESVEYEKKNETIATRIEPAKVEDVNTAQKIQQLQFQKILTEKEIQNTQERLNKINGEIEALSNI